MHTTLCNLPRPGMFCVQNAIHAHRLLGWNKTVVLCYLGLQSALLLSYFSANPISTFVAVWKPQNKSILNLLNTKSMTLFKLQLSQQNDNTFANRLIITDILIITECNSIYSDVGKFTFWGGRWGSTTWNTTL